MPYFKITVTPKYEKELHGIRWFPQYDMDTIRDKVLKALYKKKSPILIEKVDIIQLNDDDPEVRKLEKSEKRLKK